MNYSLGDEPERSETESDLLHQICSDRGLYDAWRKVRANRGAAGIDAVSIRDFERDLERNLRELRRLILTETYQPFPARLVTITKSSGKSRELGILSVRDRVGQRAVLDRLEPEFDRFESDSSYAFRSDRNVEAAVREILVSRANGFCWTVESDIKDFFPSIDREILIRDLGLIVSDKSLLRLISIWLESGILEETWWARGGRTISEIGSVGLEAASDKFAEIVGIANEDPYQLQEYDLPSDISPFAAQRLEQHETRRAAIRMVKEGLGIAYAYRGLLAKFIGAKTLGIGGAVIAGAYLAPKIANALTARVHPRKGILQGSPLSPSLANIYLTDFDRKLGDGKNRLVRYCDDFVILCRSAADAEAALERARSELSARKLSLHPEKTRIAAPDSEFDFLGYRFLPDGGVIPPPTATAATVHEMRELSRRARRGFTEMRFKITKLRFDSWRDYFAMFGPKDKE